ncbi:MAG TPA: MTAP family purine nucleoside phosphorylase [Candidatus Thermoplasmatota archaeon]|nr:MTAP family purine nucleoside phosphorylase [Candidatus Thermoplasmatota archaeon]
MKLGVIAGTGFYDLTGGETLPVDTPWGPVEVAASKRKDRTIFFLARHGSEHQRPPHRVEHRANVWALAACGVERVLAVNTVGSLHLDWKPGTFVVPSDFVDFSGRAATFFDDEAVHVDMTEPYCPQARKALLAAARPAAREGVYACTQGPRLETPSEIRLLSQVADVVGMTGYPEVVLAREKGLCYASLCVVSNPAAGLARSLPIDEVLRNARRSEKRVRETILAALLALPARRACGCREAAEKARIGATTKAPRARRQ